MKDLQNQAENEANSRNHVHHLANPCGTYRARIKGGPQVLRTYSCSYHLCVTLPTVFAQLGARLLAKHNFINLSNYLLGRSHRRRSCHPRARLVTVTTSATRFGGTHNNGHKADAEDEAAKAAEVALLLEAALVGVEDAARLRGNFRKSGAVLPSVRRFVSQRAIFEKPKMCRE